MSIYSNGTARFNADKLLSQMPGGILKWGNMVFLIVVAALLLLAWSLRYPQVIQGAFTLETHANETVVLAPADGWLDKQIVLDSALVLAGSLLAILHTADAEGHELQVRLNSPQNGLVQLDRNFQPGQKITKGTPFCMLRAENHTPATAIMLAPVAIIGKIKAGQMVLLRFEGYPTEDFGVVKASVESIGKLPSEHNCRVYLSLPNPLTTTQKATISPGFGMRGTAEIIVDNPRLLERMIQPLKMILDRQRAQSTAQNRPVVTPQFTQKGD